MSHLEDVTKQLCGWMGEVQECYRESVYREFIEKGWDLVARIINDVQLLEASSSHSLANMMVPLGVYPSHNGPLNLFVSRLRNADQTEIWSEGLWFIPSRLPGLWIQAQEVAASLGQSSRMLRLVGVEYVPMAVLVQGGFTSDCFKTMSLPLDGRWVARELQSPATIMAPTSDGGYVVVAPHLAFKWNKEKGLIRWDILREEEKRIFVGARTCRQDRQGKKPWRVLHYEPSTTAISVAPSGAKAHSYTRGDNQKPQLRIDQGREWKAPDSFIKIVWTPDSRGIAAIDADGGLWLCLDSQASAKPNFQLLEYPGSIRAVAWSPDGSILAAGGTAGVGYWELKDSQVVHTAAVTDGHRSPVSSIAWSPDGCRIVSVDETGVVWIWWGDTLRPLMAFRSWEGHTGHWMVCWSSEEIVLIHESLLFYTLSSPDRAQS